MQPSPERRVAFREGLRPVMKRLARLVLRSCVHLPDGLKKSWLGRRSKKWLLPDAAAASPGAPAPLCVLPWIHAHVATSGNVHLCCLSLDRPLGTIHSHALIDIFAAGAFGRIRGQMLKGEWPEECHGCRDREAFGLPSFRHYSNSKSPPYVHQLTSNPHGFVPAIRSIDLRLNNICNFKCRSCGADASNRWLSDHNLINPEFQISQSYQGFDKKPGFWREFDEHILPGLEELDVAGGEPLINQSQYRLLEKLIAQGKQTVRLHVVTNLSELRFMHWDAVELWKNFPHLTVNISLDGVGAQGEYIRCGLNYSKWVENLRRLQKELPHATRTLHFVVSIFNVVDLRRHYDTIVEGRFVDPSLITFTFLHWPPFLSVQVLQPELKATVTNEIRVWLAEALEMPRAVKAQLEALLDFMNAADSYPMHGAQFAAKTRLLDGARAEDSLALFPKLRPMLLS